MAKRLQQEDTLLFEGKKYFTPPPKIMSYANPTTKVLSVSTVTHGTGALVIRNKDKNKLEVLGRNHHSLNGLIYMVRPARSIN